MKKVSFLFLSMLMLSGLNAEVKIGGNNEQKVTVQNGVIGNSAVGVMSKAEQNIASNEGN